MAEARSAKILRVKLHRANSRLMMRLGNTSVVMERTSLFTIITYVNDGIKVSFVADK